MKYPEKEYRSGDMRIVAYANGDYEIWNNDGFVTIPQNKALDFSNVAMMYSNDVIAMNPDIYGGLR